MGKGISLTQKRSQVAFAHGRIGNCEQNNGFVDCMMQHDASCKCSDVGIGLSPENEFVYNRQKKAIMKLRKLSGSS